MVKPLRILMVTQYFPPEMGAPQARLFELASRLQKSGHTVHVLTAMPNYPTGRVFPGYRGRLVQTTDMNGIRVVRTWLHPSNSQRILPRLWGYLSFAMSGLALGPARLGRYDVAVVESPPLFLAPSGWLLSKLTGARSVFMVSDIWPDILIRMGKAEDGLALRVMLCLERWAYRHYDMVALTNPGAMRQIAERFPGIPVSVISNGVDTDLFRPERRSQELRSSLSIGDDDFLVGYCGLHGMAQGLDAVIGAAELLRERREVKFVFIGDGPCKQDLMAAAAARGLRNVDFRDSMPKDRMPAIVASCDTMLVPLSARLPGTMPSKVYEALASGTPPIVAKGCEAEQLVQQHEVGLAFEPGSANELAEAIATLVDSPMRLATMRDRTVMLAQRFSRDKIARRTEQLLQAVATGQSPPPV